MLQLKKLIVCILLCAFGMCICACSGGADELILIGSEESSVVTSISEKNRGTKHGLSDATEDVSDGVQEDIGSTIRVYVCGAVRNPGVVEVPVDSRVENALEAAGGFAENAESTYVNLAAWLADGQMIYFPTEEEVCGGQEPLVSESLREAGTGYVSGGDTDGLVNINTADVQELCTLPGIGESRAADIIVYREANGFFETCEDIMRVPGIKTGLFEKIRDKISVK